MTSLHSQYRAQAPATASKPAKSVIRPTNNTKRKIDKTDFDDDLLPADLNPTKKPRVTFNPDVEKREIVEYAAKGRSLDTIRAEVRKALEAHAKGDLEGYGTVRAVFSTKREYDDDDEEDEQEDEDEIEKRLEIRTYVIALTGYASHLDKSCSTLVNDILHCEWMGRDEGFIKAYIHFLGSLASAQGAYVGKVLEMLVGYFAGVRFSSGRLPGYPDVKRDQLSSRVHSALKYLLRLIPSASSLLSPIMSKKFPDSEESKKAHVNYVQNLFRLMEYAPELKSDIFALVTEKLVDIDVQMQVRLDEEDEIATAVMKAITVSGKAAIEDGGDDTDSDGDSESSDDDINSDSKRIQQAQSHVEKMDAMLDILFTKYDTYFLDDPMSDKAVSTFEMLLSHFANIILPTCQSRHTQFLLFHFSQRHAHLIDQFAGTCVQLAFESGRPAVLRNSAAAYLASFVSRGKHVEGHVVVTVFELIGSHLERIRIDSERTCRGPDLRRYGTFYAMTQALLYIFCFRWRDLLTNDLDEEDPDAFMDVDELKWMPGIKDTFSRVIGSTLNPLKVCSQPIVQEWAKIARHLGFMYVYSLLETNRRVRLSQYALGAGSGALRDVGSASNESWHQLEAHFPFDPYVLPKSRRWVDDDYRQWQSIRGLEPEEESDSEEDSGDEVERIVVQDGTATDDDNA